jgi:hypothetical protein
MTTSTPKPRPTPRQPSTGIDDTPLAEPLFSPVCTFCKWWGAHPDRWQFCSAWPHTAGKPIPQPIWNGTPGKVSGFYHTQEVSGDHGIVFEPVPGAKLPPKLRAAYEAAKGKPSQK